MFYSGKSESNALPAVVAASFFAVLLLTCVAVYTIVMVVILIKYKQKIHAHLNKQTTTVTLTKSAYEDIVRHSAKATTIHTGKNINFLMAKWKIACRLFKPSNSH